VLNKFKQHEVERKQENLRLTNHTTFARFREEPTPSKASSLAIDPSKNSRNASVMHKTTAGIFFKAINTPVQAQEAP